jgi:hypothetical protein
VQDATEDPARNVTGQWAVTIHDVPGAPPKPTIPAKSSGQATVSIDAPSETGNLAIDQYTITASNGSTKVVSSTGSYVMTGLTNGTAYTFTVKAHNKDGYGAPSPASDSVTPYGTPSAPRSLAGTVSGYAPATVQYTWAAPSDTGGGAVTYHYVYDGGAEKTTTATSLSFTSQAAASYKLELWAVNNGSSLPSTQVTDTETVSTKPVTPSVAVTRGPVTGGCKDTCFGYVVTLKDFSTNSHSVQLYCESPGETRAQSAIGSVKSFTGNTFSTNSSFCGFDPAWAVVDGVTSPDADFNPN